MDFGPTYDAVRWLPVIRVDALMYWEGGDLNTMRFDGAECFDPLWTQKWNRLLAPLEEAYANKTGIFDPNFSLDISWFSASADTGGTVGGGN